MFQPHFINGHSLNICFVFWVVIPCSEDWGSKILSNVGIIHHYTASHPGRSNLDLHSSENLKSHACVLIKIENVSSELIS